MRDPGREVEEVIFRVGPLELEGHRLSEPVCGLLSSAG